MPKKSSQSSKAKSQELDEVMAENHGDEENVPENIARSRSPKSKEKTPTKSSKKTPSPKSKEKSPKRTKSPSQSEEKEKKKKKKKKSEESENIPKFGGKETLFKYVSSAKAASATLIEEVMKPYAKDPAKTVTTLLNFVIESAGCPNKLSSSEIDEEDVEKVIKGKIVTKEYMMQSEGDYPLLSRKNEFKKFKSNFNEFWTKLLTKSSDKVIYDDYFLETLTAWLRSFCNNKARAIRHASTLAGLGLITSLVKVAGRVKQEFDVSSRQLKVEKKSKSNL